MIRYTLLSLSLFACSSFDAQENAKEPSNSSYKIIDASDSINVDPEQNDFTTPNSVVMTIPELGLEVIEEESEVDVQPDSETPGMLDYEETEEADDSDTMGTNDFQIKLLEVTSFPEDSDLTAELSGKRPMKILAISSFPKIALQNAPTEHYLKILLHDQNKVYTSEILQAIVTAVENEADYIYIPLTAEGMPEILFEAIDYATSKRVMVFDAAGNRI